MQLQRKKLFLSKNKALSNRTPKYKFINEAIDFPHFLMFLKQQNTLLLEEP